jgi:hypothetical protein
VGLFRKRDDTYNEQMLREAGLLLDPQPETFAPEPTLLAKAGLPDGAGVGPGDWDAATTATAPGVAGDKVEFTTLPDGDLIVDQEAGNGDLAPLADAIEESVRPPYKAVGMRQRGDLWSVAAKRIVVAKIEFPGADSVDLSRRDSWEEFRVDGEPSDKPVPGQLREAGARAGADFYAKAERIDGDFWEVRVSAL